MNVPCCMGCSAKVAVEAAAREVAGVEAGDGRDESNRSLAQRLADAKRDGTTAAAEAKAAAILEKGAVSELARLKKVAASRGKESSKAEQVGVCVAALVVACHGHG